MYFANVVEAFRELQIAEMSIHITAELYQLWSSDKAEGKPEKRMESSAWFSNYQNALENLKMEFQCRTVQLAFSIHLMVITKDLLNYCNFLSHQNGFCGW